MREMALYIFATVRIAGQKSNIAYQYQQKVREKKMETEQRIASLAREINRLTSEFAKYEMRKIRNIYITEVGEIATIEDPQVIQDKIETCKEELNENLFELDQLIAERDK